jgi:hypothetical protein
MDNYSKETAEQKQNRVKLIQKKLSLPETGIWNRETESAYRNEMRKTGADAVSLSSKLLNKQSDSNRPIISNFGKYRQCTDKGCAEYATTLGSELLGMNRNEFKTKVNANGNAWERKSYLKDAGGQDVDMSNHGNFKVGDNVGLDRQIGSKEGDKNGHLAKDKSNKRSSGNPHVGVVVGFTDKGEPVIEHNDSGTVYRQPLSQVQLHKKYTPIWAMRPNYGDRETIKKEPVVLNDKRLKINSDNPIRKQFVETINNNLSKFVETSGLSQDDILHLGKMSLGILENESESGNTKTPLGLKRFVADLAFKTGLKKEPASEGLTQIKPTVFNNPDGSLTYAGKYKPYFGIESVTNNPKDSANATMLNLIQNYKRIKEKNPDVPKETLLTMVARSHKGLSDRGLENIKNDEDSYSAGVFKNSEDVTFDGDTSPKIEDIRKRRQARYNETVKNMLPKPILDSISNSQTASNNTPRKIFSKGGIITPKLDTVYYKAK